MRSPFRSLPVAVGLAFIAAPLALPARAGDLAAARKLVLNHCGACHGFAEGQPHGQGPNLWGVMGRQAGTAAGFAYSDGFRKVFAGKAWDAKLVDAWITDAQAMAPGTVMLYKQTDEEKRAMVVEYLESLQ